MEYCLFTEPQQGATYDDQLAFARAGERLGFDGFFRSDHYLRMGDGDPLPGPTDAWTTLAGLARETSRIRLGTLVSSVTYRHPGILAIQVAQVDAMSGGRVELGLGTGWFEREHRAYGIPFPAKRFDLLEEQLAVVGRERSRRSEIEPNNGDRPSACDERDRERRLEIARGRSVRRLERSRVLGQPRIV